jgi:hypothetical protein
MEPNPYSPPVHAEPKGIGGSVPVPRSTSIIGTTKRRIALAVFLLPLLLALPVRYWVFHVAESWFVSTEIDPDQRRMFVGLMYLLVMAAVVGASIFPGLLFLFIDGYRRILTGWLMVPAFLGFVFALLIFASMVDAYRKFA